ncbi:MAG: class B sortase [Oscillospiraceae bacterium]|nr:class B sortase [Oscillospiraceae bacterium]
MNKKLQLLLVVIAGILVGVMSFSAYKLISDKTEHKDARVKDDSVKTTYTYQGDTTAAATPRPYTQEEEEALILDDEISPLNNMYDFDAFYAEYEDAIGWLYSPETPIDYGVVEAEDNDFYLHRFLDGDFSISGSLFADCKNHRDFSDQNTIIYGHHMNDGTKFASLVNYRTEGYYAEHPVMYLSTPTMNYRVEIFAAYLTDADSDTYMFRFENEEDYADYLARMIAQSDIDTPVQVGPKDHIITLSTCSYEFYDARYVVQGKLVPIH